VLPGILNYFAATLPELAMPTLGRDLAAWYSRGGIWLARLVDTFWIALFATILGTAIAFLLSFLAARNLSPHPAAYVVTRRLMEVARSIPELVYALGFVFAFGIGPLPGVLAIAVHTVGSQGKLFSEVNENIDPGQLEGARSSGANWFQVMRYGVVPQVLPNFLSYGFLRLEGNVRVSTVIGLVGAGGIGVELIFAIRQFQYKEISAILLMIIALVVTLDLSSEQLRRIVLRETKAL
jgi:phosphonate transport system permease protein